MELQPWAASAADEPVKIRPASAADMAFIAALLRHYVATSDCIYVDDPDVYSVAERLAWFAGLGERHPVIIATIGDVPIGYGSIGPYNVRAGYRFTGLHSVYVHPDAHRRGVGSALLGSLVAMATELGYHALVGSVDSEQEGSLALHRKHGFVERGRLPEVGCKGGKWRTVCYMHLKLSSSDPTL